MYKDFYRLHEEPFNITPDPRFLYLTGQHREALNHLLYGIHERKGFICLTGEVGTGKTTLCRALLNRLGAGCHTALILNPVLTNSQLLLAILFDGKHSAGVGSQGFVGIAHGALNVLRIVVAPTNNDDVFYSARNN